MTRLILLSLFGPLAPPFLVPAKTASAVARRRGQGRPFGRRALRASLDGGEHGRTLVVVGSCARASRASRAAAALFVAIISLEATAPKSACAESVGIERPLVVADIAEASRRSGLPEAWIKAVAWVESGGATDAVSPKGAMGVMQIMPGTWRDLRGDLGLGSDPFDRRDNLVAGAVYLRRMLDRFGARGFLAAYNAGPARYQAFLDGKRSLPSETVAYVARVRARIGWNAPIVSPRRTTTSADWRTSDLFVGAISQTSSDQDQRVGQSIFAGRAREVSQ